jgi:diguanylate cyclase (GGDEF)-like protein
MPQLDSATVIWLTAFQLGATGALGLLFGRRLAYRGARLLAGSLVLFGLAFLLRLLSGPASISADTVLVDFVPVLAALLLVQGLRAFHRRRMVPTLPAVLALLVYVLGHLELLPAGGPVARVLLQAGVLGSLFLAAGASLIPEARSQQGPRRHPLILLVVLVCGLGAAGWTRCAYVLAHGSEPLYRGPAAQLFYLVVSLSCVLLTLGLLWMVFARMQAELSVLAARDALTHSLNRYGLKYALRQHFGRRLPAPLALLQVDIDHFKGINDRWGHETGDRVLRAVSDALQAGVRSGDFVARMGGEEFVIGCAVRHESDAALLAERLRGSVEALELRTPAGERISCSVSIGVSQPIHSRSHWRAALRAADRALYLAKSAGRNCVRLALPEPAAA